MATTPSSKLKTKHLHRMMLGVIPLALFLYPAITGLVVYAILRICQVQEGAKIAIISGYASLFFLPCYILGNAFWVITHPELRQSEKIEPKNNLKQSELIDIWKTCLDVQMHFNDIELQIRNYAVTLLVAVTGAAAYAFKEHLDVELAGHLFSMAIAILPAGILGWSAFYFMDRLWYHRLLLGAVYQTLNVEKLLSPELLLSHAIGLESPIPIWGRKIHSTQKIDLFYAAGLTFFILFTGIVLLQGERSIATVTPPASHQVQLNNTLLPPDSGKVQLPAVKEQIQKKEQDPKTQQTPQPK